MKRISMAAIAVMLVCLVVSPAFSGVAHKKGNVFYRIGNSVYDRGAMFVNNTETHLTGIAKNVFSLFNPCLDLIKGCSSVVMTPVDIPLNYVAGMTASGKKGARSRIPVPKKPTIPKK